MQENTNKAIAINSIILYVRMVITAVCAILTTRYALIALGVSDFGLFSLLGGIISFVLIFNTIMLSTTNRFIAVALGKGDIKEEVGINSQSGTSMQIKVAEWESKSVNSQCAIDSIIGVNRGGVINS